MIHCCFITRLNTEPIKTRPLLLFALSWPMEYNRSENEVFLFPESWPFGCFFIVLMKLSSIFGKGWY